MRRIRGFISSLSLLLAGCLYGFAGGGLPPGIRTVAVLPFDNLTPEPVLSQEINDAVRRALENRLGLRQSGEGTADAIVSGTISRYAPDQPIAVTGASGNVVEVTRRQVQIVVSVRIITRADGKTLWERQSMLLTGEYESGQEPEGRRKALDQLVINIVDGAQSQW